MTEEQRREIRQVLSGQEEEPVTLVTGQQLGADEGPGPLEVSAEEVVKQLELHDPMLLELLALRAVVARL